MHYASRNYDLSSCSNIHYIIVNVTLIEKLFDAFCNFAHKKYVCICIEPVLLLECTTKCIFKCAISKCVEFAKKMKTYVKFGPPILYLFASIGDVDIHMHIIYMCNKFVPFNPSRQKWYNQLNEE